MNYSLDCILTSLEDHINKTENGYIKLGFENGRLVAASLYNNPSEDEKKFPAVKNDFSLKDEIRAALKNTFYGTLGYVFTDKRITNFYKSQSWKGATLELFVKG